jgi:Myb/SANT-like DNA-binding protein
MAVTSASFWYPFSSQAPRKKNAVWSVEECQLLVSLLKQAKVDGHWGDNGFKATTYTIAPDGLADPLKTGGNDGTCQLKWTHMKKDYKEVKFLMDCSGFGWDEDNHVAYCI